MIYIVKFTYYTYSGTWSPYVTGRGHFKAVFSSIAAVNTAIDRHKETYYGSESTKLVRTLKSPTDVTGWVELINDFVIPNNKHNTVT
jgi:hypothetical protein